jgi:hypothetical protein
VDAPLSQVVVAFIRPILRNHPGRDEGINEVLTGTQRGGLEEGDEVSAPPSNYTAGGGRRDFAIGRTCSEDDVIAAHYTSPRHRNNLL